MKNLIGTKNSTKDQRGFNKLAQAWSWLIEPSPLIIEPERRFQARLLMAMLLVLLLLGLLSLTLSLLGFYTHLDETDVMISEFRWVTVGAVLLLGFEYGLSRSVHYLLAAILTVSTLMISLFAVVIISPTVTYYLFFLIFGGLTASLFLSARATAIVFLVTLIGCLFLPVVSPGFSTANNVHALIFILGVGGLVVLAATLRQHYLDQIDSQTQKLVESESLLRELSIRDSLTGLFNRRYFEEALAIEMIRATRKHYPIGIIMVDIDHFKQFNDAHGHAAGDEVLVQVGNFLRAHVRSSDVTCRYGGEEFIVILPEASGEITKMRAEQIRDDIRHLHVQFDGLTLDSITLSLGIAVFPKHGQTEDEFLGAADAALYRAKSDGRDRVVVAE
ncbi:MAG TPA: GGDEF domain-containing protein [Anaerolineales bacterium]|nr:GGDEF domain-containing protein [Anaerolineales bacterium]